MRAWHVITIVAILASVLAACAPAPETPQSPVSPQDLISTNIAATFAVMPTFTPWPTATTMPTITPKPTRRKIIVLDTTITPFPSLTALPRNNNAGGNPQAVATNGTPNTPRPYLTAGGTRTGFFKCEKLSIVPQPGTVYSPGQTFNMVWTVKNVGEKVRSVPVKRTIKIGNRTVVINRTIRIPGDPTWRGDTVDLVYIKGPKLQLGPKIYDIPKTTYWGETVTFTVYMQAPSERGEYEALWGLAHGIDIFCWQTVSIVVK